MSIRIRLAAAFTLLVGAILILVGLATYQLLRQSLLADIERDVAQRAAAIAKEGTVDPDSFGAPDVFVQVIDAGGMVLARSSNLGDRTLPTPDDQAVVEVRLQGRPLFLTAAPLGDGQQVIVARSPVTTYQALRGLRQLLYLVVGGAVLVTSVASWLFAKSALRPIDRIVDAARQVRDSRDPNRRVAYSGPADEVGRLAVMFNAMLAELAATQASLDQSNQRMRQFLADCSHELRTPLTRIRSTVDLLVRAGDSREDSEMRTRALADVGSEADRMTRLVQQLLILARADAGATIAPRRVLIGEIIKDAHRQASRSAATVTVHPPALERLNEVSVHGDADLLTQLLLILLDNAVKYTPAGGQVRVEARARHTMVEISVADDGPGIPQEDQALVFDRFYRGRNARLATGTGLGLAIARWIVEQHHGEIALVSGAEGSRFTARLPLSHQTGR